MYPVCVSDCPEPERVIFCILIVDPISRSALLVFSMLSATNYHYNKGPVCYVSLFYSQYCYSELSILFLFLLSRDTFVQVYSLLFSIDLQRFCYFIMLYLKLSQNFDFLTNICSFVVFLDTQFSQQTNKTITFNFRTSTTSAEKKSLLPK